MKLVIVGAGNVASVLGRLIKNAGHDIIQVVSRHSPHAEMLANELGCRYAVNSSAMNREADMYLIAIADNAMHEIEQWGNFGDKLMVHTAGSVSKDILVKLSSKFGVLYPLQSLRKEKSNFNHEIPLLVDGNAAETIAAIEKFALTISSSVERVTDEQRLKLHIASVIVSNFSNHMYSLAFDYCSKEGISFKMLQPLIEETALRLRDYRPADMQTGPAIRKDISTLDKHLRTLSSYPRLRNIYLKITESIMNQ